MLAGERKVHNVSIQKPYTTNPLLKHWRGGYAVVPTLVITLLTLRAAMGLVQSFIPAPFINLWLVFSIVVLIWQLVGTWRSIDRYLRERGSVAGSVAAHLYVLGALIVTVVQFGDALASKTPVEVPQVTLRTLPLTVDKKTVRVDGNFDWDLFSAFERTLKDNADIENVRLSSSGGYVYVARAMALAILERQLNTHVELRCYSACTVAFIAGEHRTMSDAAKLGFHQYKLESASPGLIDLDEELEKDQKFFATRGIPTSFLERVFVTDHADLWMPEKSDLLAAGVVHN